MDFDKLTNQVCEVLERYGWLHNKQIVKDVLLKEWYKAKLPLIELLRHHKNWNEDALAIVFDTDVKRPVDTTVFYNELAELFEDFYRSEKHMNALFPAGAKFQAFFSDDHQFEVEKVNFNVISWRGKRTEIETTEGCTIGDIADIYLVNGKRIPNQSTLDLFTSPTVNEALKLQAAELGIDARCGTKTPKVLRKIFASIGMDTLSYTDIPSDRITDQNVIDILIGNSDRKLPNLFEQRFAKMADAISPMDIKRFSTLSVHPCDYLLMSHGTGWRSCHYIDGGCYQAGTMSYMTDPCTMIFSIISADYKGEIERLWNEEKINRQVFCYENGTLLQSRLYPNCRDFDNIDNFRHVVQEIISTCLDMPNSWTKKSKVREYVVTKSGAKHYPDYNYSEYNCVVTLNKHFPRTDEHMIAIGSPGICPNCGESLPECDSLICYDCNNQGRVQCADCGEWGNEDDFYRLPNGDYICDHCYDNNYFTCDCCGEIHEWDDGTEVGRYDRVCGDCLDAHYTQCDCCGEYVRNGDITVVKGGDEVCLDCRAELYKWCGFCDDWVPADETEKTDDGKTICVDCQVARQKEEE